MHRRNILDPRSLGRFIIFIAGVSGSAVARCRLLIFILFIFISPFLFYCILQDGNGKHVAICDNNNSSR